MLAILNRRQFALGWIMLLGFGLTYGYAPRSVFAQAEEAEEKAEKKAEEKADEKAEKKAEEKVEKKAEEKGEKAAVPAEGKGGNEAAADAGGEAPKKETKRNESYFWWFIKNSGFIGLVILILSIYFVSTVGRLFLEMRPSVAMPPDLVDECEDLLTKRQFKEIFAAVKDDQSPWGRIVSTGIAELPNGLAEAREAADRVAEVITVENEKKISMLAVLGSLGPMIGLLGTLKGMIASFSVIAISDTQLKASEVAGGISEALLLTFEGVALSVPAIYFFAVFRNRVSYLGVSTLLNGDEFIRRFAHAARGKAAPAAGTAPAAAPAAKAPTK